MSSEITDNDGDEKSWKEDLDRGSVKVWSESEAGFPDGAVLKFASRTISKHAWMFAKLILRKQRTLAGDSKASKDTSTRTPRYAVLSKAVHIPTALDGRKHAVSHTAAFGMVIGLGDTVMKFTAEECAEPSTGMPVILRTEVMMEFAREQKLPEWPNTWKTGFEIKIPKVNVHVAQCSSTSRDGCVLLMFVLWMFCRTCCWSGCRRPRTSRSTGRNTKPRLECQSGVQDIRIRCFGCTRVCRIRMRMSETNSTTNVACPLRMHTVHGRSVPTRHNVPRCASLWHNVSQCATMRHGILMFAICCTGLHG